MKKISKITNIDVDYKISGKLSDNISLVKKDDKESILNTKTNELLKPFGEYNFYDIYNYLIIRTSDSISIYDLEENKMIFDEMILISHKYSNSYIIKSPIKEEYYILKFFNNKMEILQSFDNIEETVYYDYKEIYIINKNGKKGLYIDSFYTKLGKIIYDDIRFEFIDNKKIIILSKDNKKTFYTFEQIDKVDNPLYDEITIENYFIICRNGNKYDIYTYREGIQILSNFECENLEYITKEINDQNTIMFLKFKRDGKYGLLENKYKILLDRLINSEERIVLPTIYDEIEKSIDVLMLKKDEKLGTYYIKNQTLTKSNYDTIQYLKYNCFAYYNGDICDIKDMNNNKTLITDCEIIEIHHTEITYKKDNLFGVLSIGEIPFDNYGYNSIKRNDNFYVIEENGKYGLYFAYNTFHKAIYPSIYDNIEVYQKGQSTFFKLDLDGNLSLCKVDSIIYNTNIRTLYENTKDIKFYNGFIYIELEKEKVLIDYCTERVILKTPSDLLDIKVVDNKEYILYEGYNIYENQKLIKINNRINYYITGYETKFGTIAVNEFTKSRHDAICEYIESLTEEEMDELLKENLEKNEELKKQYPNLVKKL